MSQMSSSSQIQGPRKISDDEVSVVADEICSMYQKVAAKGAFGFFTQKIKLIEDTVLKHEIKRCHDRKMRRIWCEDFHLLNKFGNWTGERINPDSIRIKGQVQLLGCKIYGKMDIPVDTNKVFTIPLLTKPSNLKFNLDLVINYKWRKVIVQRCHPVSGSLFSVLLSPNHEPASELARQGVIFEAEDFFSKSAPRSLASLIRLFFNELQFPN